MAPSRRWTCISNVGGSLIVSGKIDGGGIFTKLFSPLSQVLMKWYEEELIDV